MSVLSATDCHWLQGVAIVLLAGGSFLDPSPDMPWPTSGLFNNNVDSVSIPGIDEWFYDNVGAIASDLTCAHYIHPNSITQIAGSSWIEGYSRPTSMVSNLWVRRKSYLTSVLGNDAS